MTDKEIREVEYEPWLPWLASRIAIALSALAIGYGIAWVLTK